MVGGMNICATDRHLQSLSKSKLKVKINHVYLPFLILHNLDARKILEI